MDKIYITFNTDVQIDEKGIFDVVFKLKKEKEISDVIEMGVIFVEDEEMSKLHQDYMKTYETTDVLSFPTEDLKSGVDGVRRIGDVVICKSVVERQARDNNKSLQEEVEFLVDHGMRHLLGEHHD